MENRLDVLAKYYGVSDDVMLGLTSIPSYDKKRHILHEQEDLLSAVGIDGFLFHFLTDVCRYPESLQIQMFLKTLGLDVKGLNILDFGCGVSDYGMFFARRGANITCCDRKKTLDFVSFRFSQENLPVNVWARENDLTGLFKGQDLVIFGEILENISTPLECFQVCVNSVVKYIFTSSYPVVDAAYLQEPGHAPKNAAAKDSCLSVLTNNYQQNTLTRNRNLWIRK